MAFQILSLSGGGYLGLYTATVLADFEQRAGAPLADCFDLFAGTSIGGIIALGLAAGVPADTIRRSIERHGNRIFRRTLPARGFLPGVLRFVRSVPSALYSPEPLREVIGELVGNDTTMGQLRRAVVIPAVNISAGGPRMFKTPHHPDFQVDHSLSACDVGVATAAAPTYFPIAQVGSELYADGGLIANSPDLVALHEATHFMGAIEDDIWVLSVGTTTSSFSFPHRLGKNLGVFDWGREGRLANVMISSQQQMVGHIVRHRLGDRLVRIDRAQSPQQDRDLALDLATSGATDTIAAMAEATIREVAPHDAIARMLRNRAPAARFFYGPQAGAS